MLTSIFENASSLAVMLIQWLKYCIIDLKHVYRSEFLLYSYFACCVPALGQ